MHMPGCLIRAVQIRQDQPEIAIGRYSIWKIGRVQLARPDPGGMGIMGGRTTSS